MEWTAIKNIAIIGLSDKPERDSYRVAKYLQEKGFRIVPINPIKKEILGEYCYSSLKEVPAEIKIDLVNVFRKPEAIPEIVEQTVARRVPRLWLQEGIIHEEAAKTAKESGIEVIMDKCIMKEHRKEVV